MASTSMDIEHSQDAAHQSSATRPSVRASTLMLMLIHTHTHTLRLVRAADSLARSCRLPRRDGFPLHQRGVDANPQKPLIKASFDAQLFIRESQTELRNLCLRSAPAGKSGNFQTPIGRFRAAAVVSMSSRGVTARLTFRCCDLASAEDDSFRP